MPNSTLDMFRRKYAFVGDTLNNHINLVDLDPKYSQYAGSPIEVDFRD